MEDNENTPNFNTQRRKSLVETVLETRNERKRRLSVSQAQPNSFDNPDKTRIDDSEVLFSVSKRRLTKRKSLSDFITDRRVAGALQAEINEIESILKRLSTPMKTKDNLKPLQTAYTNPKNAENDSIEETISIQASEETENSDTSRKSSSTSGSPAILEVHIEEEEINLPTV